MSQHGISPDRREAIFDQKCVVRPQLALGLRHSRAKETEEAKLSISSILPALTELLRTTVVAWPRVGGLHHRYERAA
jgi:hypothetical protein